MKKNVLALICLFVLFPGICFAIPPIPCKIGGTLTVDGEKITAASDKGYTVTVSRHDGTGVTDASGMPARDIDGLNDADYYIIDIPVYDKKTQPGGAKPGEILVIHVYKDGTPLAVISPVKGEITLGQSGSVQLVNISARFNQ
jgi:hypothetical protein